SKTPCLVGRGLLRRVPERRHPIASAALREGWLPEDRHESAPSRRHDEPEVRIVLTTDSYLPRLGGQEMGAFRLTKYLQRRGNPVRLITTERHPLSGAEPGELDDLRAPHAFGPWSRRSLHRLLEMEFRKAEVVHSRYCYRLGAISAPVARRLSRRFVVSLHGLGLLDNPQDSTFRRWSHRRYRRSSLALADAVIATSREFAQL